MTDRRDIRRCPNRFLNEQRYTPLPESFANRHDCYQRIGNTRCLLLTVPAIQHLQSVDRHRATWKNSSMAVAADAINQNTSYRTRYSQRLRNLSPFPFDRHRATWTISSFAVAANIINLNTYYPKRYSHRFRNLSPFPFDRNRVTWQISTSYTNVNLPHLLRV